MPTWSRRNSASTAPPPATNGTGSTARIGAASRTTSSIGAKPRPTSSRRFSSIAARKPASGRANPASEPPSIKSGPSRNNIRRDLVFDAADLVAQHQLALLQTLYLDKVGAGRHRQGGDRGIEVAVLLLQARQLLPQLAFVVLRHRHRWFALRATRPGKARQLSRFPQARSSFEKIPADQRLCLRLPGRKAGCNVALETSLS